MNAQHAEVAAQIFQMLDEGQWPRIFWEGSDYAGHIELYKGTDALPMLSESDANRRMAACREMNVMPKGLTISEATLRAWVTNMVPLAHIVPVEKMLGRKP